MPVDSTLVATWPRFRCGMTDAQLGAALLLSTRDAPGWARGEHMEKSPQKIRIHLSLGRLHEVDSVAITFFLISHILHYLQRQILQWRITRLLPHTLGGPHGAGRKKGCREWRCQLFQRQPSKGHFKRKIDPCGCCVQTRQAVATWILNISSF